MKFWTDSSHLKKLLLSNDCNNTFSDWLLGLALAILCSASSSCWYKSDFTQWHIHWLCTPYTQERRKKNLPALQLFPTFAVSNRSMCQSIPWIKPSPSAILYRFNANIYMLMAKGSRKRCCHSEHSLQNQKISAWLKIFSAPGISL